MWRPDVFFVDSKQQRRHTVIRDNLFLDVRPSGEGQRFILLFLQIEKQYFHSLQNFEQGICYS